MDVERSNLPHHFYRHPLHDEDYCRIDVDKTHIHDQPVTEREKLMFPDSWEGYEKGEEQNSGQMRLEAQAWIDPLIAPMLRKAGISSVEQLAKITDQQIQRLNFPGARKMVRKAQEAVDARASVAEVDDLKARMAELEAELKAARATPTKR